MRGKFDALRCRIDEIDERVVALLNERSACALTLGKLKRAMGLEIYQPQREAEVLNHVRTASRGPLGGEAITRLFERIIDEARRLERMAQEEEDRRREPGTRNQEPGNRDPSNR
jgi:chorismate mutase-like protein